MSTLTFTLYGDVNVRIVVSELTDGTLQFDLSVLDDSGSIGDLNAVYFDLADESVTSGLSVSGDDVTGMAFKQDGVTKVDGGYTNINGEVVNELGKFDAGVQLGTSGIGTDDIRESSFILSHSSMDLTLDMLLSQDFALRLTSVGAEDGPRDDSTKIGGEAPPDPDTPDSVKVAVNDLLVVDENETFNASGAPDEMVGANGPQFSVLENDEMDFYFLESVESVNGDPAAVDQIVTGSYGGQMIIRVDGSVDFSANGEFDALNAGDTATTEFTYSIDGGSTATVTVLINGLDDEPPIDTSTGDPGIDILG